MLEKLFNETHMIAIVALFFIILAGMCSTFLYNCSRKLVRDHRIIKVTTLLYSYIVYITLFLLFVCDIWLEVSQKDVS